MADEQSNSAEQQPESGQPSEEHAGSSKMVRIIIWGLVLVFAGVALMDIASRKSYEKTLVNLEDGIDEAEEPLTLDDFENSIKSGMAIKTTGSKDGQSTILYKWPSLFRQYEIHLTVESGDEKLLATYSTNDDDNAALIGRPGSGEELDDSMLEEGGGPGGPGMNGGGPDGLEGDRPQRPESDDENPMEDNDNPEKQE